MSWNTPSMPPARNLPASEDLVSLYASIEALPHASLVSVLKNICARSFNARLETVFELLLQPPVSMSDEEAKEFFRKEGERQSGANSQQPQSTIPNETPSKEPQAKTADLLSPPQMQDDPVNQSFSKSRYDQPAISEDKDEGKPTPFQDYIRRVYDPKNRISRVSMDDTTTKLDKLIKEYKGSDMENDQKWEDYPLPQELLATERYKEMVQKEIRRLQLSTTPRNTKSGQTPLQKYILKAYAPENKIASFSLEEITEKMITLIRETRGTDIENDRKWITLLLPQEMISEEWQEFWTQVNKLLRRGHERISSSIMIIFQELNGKKKRVYLQDLQKYLHMGEDLADAAIIALNESLKFIPDPSPALRDARSYLLSQSTTHPVKTLGTSINGGSKPRLAETSKKRRWEDEDDSNDMQHTDIIDTPSRDSRRKHASSLTNSNSADNYTPRSFKQARTQTPIKTSSTIGIAHASNIQGPPRPSPRFKATQESPAIASSSSSPHKFTLSDAIDYRSLSDYSPPTDSLDKDLKTFGVRWPEHPKDLSDDPDKDLLHPAELDLASRLRFKCDFYLLQKRRLFIAFVEFLRADKENFRKADAQRACPGMNANKPGKLWDAYDKAGWLNRKWFEKYL